MYIQKIIARYKTPTFFEVTMKIKTQVVIGLLFLASFIKSFKYAPTFYDAIFIVVLLVVYLSRDFITEQKIKQDIKKLTEDVDLRLKHQDEEIERAKNVSSKAALAMGVRR